MALIQVGPSKWLDEKVARLAGLSEYKPSKAAPKPAPVASRSATPFQPVKAAPSRLPASPPAKKQPRDIPEAMNMGKTNDEIHDLVRRGLIPRPESREAAAREWGNSKVLHEAERRGLLWGLV